MTTMMGKELLTRCRSLSSRMSGAYWSTVACSSEKSHPMWAKSSPLPMALREVPNRHGECGSPISSENLWCLRWSATHWLIDPSSAYEPMMARAIFTGRGALKDPCVK